MGPENCGPGVGVVVEEAHNKLGPVTQEEGMLDTVGLAPRYKINYSGPKNTDQSLEESSSGPDFICEDLGMVTTQFRFKTNLWWGGSADRAELRVLWWRICQCTGCLGLLVSGIPCISSRELQAKVSVSAYALSSVMMERRLSAVFGECCIIVLARPGVFSLWCGRLVESRSAGCLYKGRKDICFCPECW
ncbi:hypothetical protein Ancab_017006 [Ancistrocladus abbreviatus]